MSGGREVHARLDARLRRLPRRQPRSSGAAIASQVVGASDVRPGDTLVVPATYGGIANGTWAPEATEPVADVAEIAAFRQRGRAVLRLHGAVVDGLLGSAAPPPPLPRVLDDEDVDDRAPVADWLGAVDVAQLSDEVRGWCAFFATKQQGGACASSASGSGSSRTPASRS